MKKFIIKIVLFIFLFILLSTFSFIIFNEKTNYHIDYYQPKIDQRFLSKVDEFENFISINDTINLFLGSSQIEAGINPKLFGEKWFSFANDEQNIYNSYIFLSHYLNSIIIDTVVISLHPFDFPISYIHSKGESLPYSNHNFIFFGEDSISSLFCKQYIKKTIEKLKQHIYFNIDDFIENKINNNSKKKSFLISESNNISIQHRSLPSVNMDSLFKVNPNHKDWSIKYYNNVKEQVNLIYFMFFNNLCIQSDIEAIYILMPKSKYYHINLNKSDRYYIWKNIKKSLINYTNNLYDYEMWRLENQSGLFWDEVHLSNRGAVLFSKTLENELR